MGSRHLVIGLDGADLQLVQALGPARLPQLHKLMAQGAFAALQTVQPPATLPNWTTFLTGVNPGRHGVFDFTTRHGYDVRFTAGSVREVPTLMARLDRLGKRCACIGFPATWPPERLEHGVFMSGWDAPVAFEADRSFMWPPALYDELTTRFGPQRWGEVDEFETDAVDFHRRMPSTLCARIGRTRELGRYLLDKQDWDLVALYFGESDTAAHHLWALHDPDSPRRPPQVEREVQEGLARVYEALDATVGELWAAAGQDVELTIVSDHGFGGASDKVLYLNRALAAAGLLHFHPPGPLDAATGALKEAALTRLSPRLRERIFRLGGAALPSRLESRARFGRIDMARTRAFSDELNYFPAVYLNLRGREPRGTVCQSQAEAVIEETRAALLALRDPWTGAPVVERVLPRAQLYHGPFTPRAPDLVLELHLDAGYSYNLMPSPPLDAAHAGAGDGAGAGAGAAFRRLTPAEYLGRKGRSLQGSHRGQGLYIAAGPAVRTVGQVEAGMADATATLLARMGVDPGELDGIVLDDILRRHFRRGAQRTALPMAPRARAAHAGEGNRGRVADRLRQLGYIE